MNAEPTRVRYVVMGIGINVNHVEFPDEISQDSRPRCAWRAAASGRAWSSRPLC